MNMAFLFGRKLSSVTHAIIFQFVSSLFLIWFAIDNLLDANSTLPSILPFLFLLIAILKILIASSLDEVGTNTCTRQVGFKFRPTSAQKLLTLLSLLKVGECAVAWSDMPAYAIFTGIVEILALRLLWSIETQATLRDQN